MREKPFASASSTVLVVGYSETDRTRLMYIDPWVTGSKMEYTGGIIGNKFPGKCDLLGLMVVEHDPARKTKASDSGDNIIRQDRSTEGAFKYSDNTFLEVVSAPFALIGG
jgi:hypothetical protein